MTADEYLASRYTRQLIVNANAHYSNVAEYVNRSSLDHEIRCAFKAGEAEGIAQAIAMQKAVLASRSLSPAERAEITEFIESEYERTNPSTSNETAQDR